MLPVLALDGHDILMRHHDDGVQGGIGARPTQEHAKVVDACELGDFKEMRIKSLKRGDPLTEGLIVALGDVLTRNGGDAQQFAKALDGCLVCLVGACIKRRALCDRYRCSHGGTPFVLYIEYVKIIAHAARGKWRNTLFICGWRVG